MNTIKLVTKTLNNVKCRLGKHDWIYYSEDVPYYTGSNTKRAEMNRKLAIFSKKEARFCSKCYISQIKDTHCLGLNPPGYYITWYQDYLLSRHPKTITIFPLTTLEMELKGTINDYFEDINNPLEEEITLFQLETGLNDQFTELFLVNTRERLSRSE